MNRGPYNEEGFTPQRGAVAGAGLIALGTVLKFIGPEEARDVATACLFVGAGFTLNCLVRSVTGR